MKLREAPFMLGEMRAKSYSNAGALFRTLKIIRHLAGEAGAISAPLPGNLKTARVIGNGRYRNQFPPLISQFFNLRPDGNWKGKLFIVLQPERPIHRPDSTRYTNPFILP